MLELERGPIAAYFHNLWDSIVTTIKGMRLTSSYLLKPKTTLQYPEERPEITARHRGVHQYNELKCELCKQCITACPVDCITIEALGKGRNFLITRFDIDYSKCLFCNLCCEACNPNCLHLGEQFETATSIKENCIIHFARTKSLEELEEFKQKLEEKTKARMIKQEATKNSNDNEVA